MIPRPTSPIGAPAIRRPAYDPSYRLGDNLYTSSAIAFDAANGKIRWYHQYTPNDDRDYDETGTHIIIDTKVNGEDRKILSHAGRNGFEYIFDRLNGQFLKASQHVKECHLDQGHRRRRPASRSTTIPTKDLQVYAETASVGVDKSVRSVCPNIAGGTNFWPASYSRRTGLLYIPTYEGCSKITVDTGAHVKGNFAGGARRRRRPRSPAALVMLDPATGEPEKRVETPYPNSAGVLATAGGIVVTALIDGTITRV